jgi:hypothetical protein
VKHIHAYRQVIYPLLVPALIRNSASSSHWNTIVHTATFEVINAMTEADPVLWQEWSAREKQASEKVKGLLHLIILNSFR